MDSGDGGSAQESEKASTSGDSIVDVLRKMYINQQELKVKEKKTSCIIIFKKKNTK